MTFNASVRGYRPRPYTKAPNPTRYFGSFVLLDLDAPVIMTTVELEREFPSEREMNAAAELVGKNCKIIVEGLKVGIDGEARFTGSIELPEAPKK